MLLQVVVVQRINLHCHCHPLAKNSCTRKSDYLWSSGCFTYWFIEQAFIPFFIFNSFTLNRWIYKRRSICFSVSAFVWGGEPGVPRASYDMTAEAFVFKWKVWKKSPTEKRGKSNKGPVKKKKKSVLCLNQSNRDVEKLTCLVFQLYII